MGELTIWSLSHYQIPTIVHVLTQVVNKGNTQWANMITSGTQAVVTGLNKRSLNSSSM